MKIARLLLPQLAFAALLAAAPIPTQEVALEMDPAQTKVEFTPLAGAAHRPRQLRPEARLHPL